MFNKRLLNLFGIAAAASLMLAACAPAAPAAPGAPAAPAAAEPAKPTDAPKPAEEVKPTEAPAAGGKSVTLGFQQEPSALSPYFSVQTFAWWASMLVNVNLWTYNDKDEPVLELAEAVPSAQNGGVSADGKTITIKLKKDLKWSDGEPITSADLKFTYEQIIKAENTGITSRSGWDKIEKVETPDALTTIFTFKEVYAPWQLLFSYTQGSLMPMHVLKDLKTLDGSDWVLKGTVTHGPFKVTEVVKGDRIVLEANDLYWRGRPKLDKIFIKIVPDRDALLAGLRAGDVDIGVDFAESNIPDIEGLKDQLNLFAVPGPAFEHYLFNMGNKWPAALTAEQKDKVCPFQDVKVRQAFLYGIDRFTIADKLLFGKTKVVAGLWPNSIFEDPELKPYAFDPEKAKSLLDEAGYKAGADGIRAGKCDGKDAKLSFRHSTTTPNQLRANVQAIVQQNLKDIGIEFIPDNKPSDVLFDTFTNNGTLTSGSYELGGYTTQFVNGGDPDPSDNFMISGIPTAEANGGNYYRLEDAELDALSKEQAGVADPAKRLEIIRKMQKVMYDKAYVIPMYARLSVSASTKRVIGLKPGPTTDQVWNPYEWDVQ
jgi:peptide/nickel transport system substrate-binding protein